ncbi:MAG: ornithine cyclodeaminase family protein [Tissierellia bacterium]|nr:ornithine cyclodeaminase family protein [Tissierellia bacterium]
MLLISRSDIKKVFTMKDAIEAVKLAFMTFSEGKSDVPLRTVIQAPKYEATFVIMPGYAAQLDTAAVKVVNIFPKNVELEKSTAPAVVTVFDGTTGEPAAIVDGTYVTQLRTGAASGAAFELLAKKDCKKGALIGTGGQAACQLEAMVCAKDLEVVKVYSRNKERTQAFAQQMNEELKAYGCLIEAANSSDEAIEDADIIVTVTPSTKPVFDGDKLKKGATVSCVGAYQHHMQELDPKALVRADKIYFDSKEAVLSEAGDITIPLNEGLITEDDFTGDLGDVILGNIKGRESEDEIIIFETVGIAVQDLITAKAIFDIAKEKGIGTNWEADN